MCRAARVEGWEMSSPGSVTQLLVQLRSPDQETRERAAQAIVGRYFQTLVTLALRRLSRRIRPLVDGEDVAQSALGSFFRCERDDRFVLEGRDNLEKLLIAITLNKALKTTRFHTAPKRDVNRVEHSPEPEGSAEGPYPHWLFEHMDRSEPTPEEVMSLAEMIDGLPDQLRAVVELKLMGFQDKEVAEKLGLSPETIRLRKRRIENEWQTHFQVGRGPGDEGTGAA
jgi:RNA polymerase sigma factor (sigma-70 family)